MKKSLLFSLFILALSIAPAHVYGMNQSRTRQQQTGLSRLKTIFSKNKIETFLSTAPIISFTALLATKRLRPTQPWLKLKATLLGSHIGAAVAGTYHLYNLYGTHNIQNLKTNLCCRLAEADAKSGIKHFGVMPHCGCDVIYRPNNSALPKKGGKKKTFCCDCGKAAHTQWLSEGKNGSGGWNCPPSFCSCKLLPEEHKETDEAS